MQEPPVAVRFSVRAMFVWTTFIALGLTALRFPIDGIEVVVKVVFVFLVAYASVLALVSSGSRRLFWAAFVVTAVVLTINDARAFKK